MNFRIPLAFFFLIFICGQIQAQKIKTKGDLSFLKEVKNIELAFDYNNMGVGKYDKEEDYLNDRVEKRNQKEPGAGDEWKASWINDRQERFEPNFTELFNKHINDDGIKASKDLESAPVKLLVKTTYTEPGFNVGVVRKSAHINVEILYIDNETNKTLASMDINKVPGRGAMGYDFDTGYRLEEAYAKLGKEVAKYISKKVL